MLRSFCVIGLHLFLRVDEQLVYLGCELPDSSLILFRELINKLIASSLGVTVGNVLHLSQWYMYSVLLFS